MIRVLLVDDQELVRSGLRLILSAQADIEVVGEAADGVAAVAEARRLRPDVVLMDIKMPGIDGIEATRRLLRLQPELRVVVLTTFDRDRLVYDALTAGATGFLLKDAPTAQLVAGVRTAARGEELLAPSITRRLIEEFTRTARAPAPAGYERLTEREREVLLLLAGGLSNDEIARELYLGVQTVKTHVARVLAKLGARDRVQAVVLAYRSGLVTPGSS